MVSAGWGQDGGWGFRGRGNPKVRRVGGAQEGQYGEEGVPFGQWEGGAPRWGAVEYSPGRLTVSGDHIAQGSWALRSCRAAVASTGPRGEWRGSAPKCSGVDISFRRKRSSASGWSGRVSGSVFTSMTSSDISSSDVSISSSELAAGAGSTRRGVLPALRRDMRHGAGRAGVPGGRRTCASGGGRGAGQAASVLTVALR